MWDAVRTPGTAGNRAASEAMKNVHMAGTSDIREIKVLGDWAYIRTYIEITVMPPAGTPMQRRGYTLSILRKQSDGKWVLWREANCLQVTSGLRRRNQPFACRDYPALAPKNNGLHSSYSRHRVSASNRPGTIWPLQNRSAISNFAKHPALNGCRSRLRHRSAFRPNVMRRR